MLLAIFLVVLSALGVAFYARFMYAMCKECALRRICNLVCLRTHRPKHAIQDERVFEPSTARAA
jgi:hypothetical protein